MNNDTNSPRYTSFADLAKAIGTTPQDLRKQYLDKAIADTVRADEQGSASTPDEMDAIAREIADGAERPVWNKGDYFGTLYKGPMAAK